MSDKLKCPECGAKLEECMGIYGEELYDGVRCPNNCDLRVYYGD